MTTEDKEWLERLRNFRQWIREEMDDHFELPVRGDSKAADGKSDPGEERETCRNRS